MKIDKKILKEFIRLKIIEIKWTGIILILAFIVGTLFFYYPSRLILRTFTDNTYVINYSHSNDFIPEGHYVNKETRKMAYHRDYVTDTKYVIDDCCIDVSYEWCPKKIEWEEAKKKETTVISIEYKLAPLLFINCLLAIIYLLTSLWFTNNWEKAKRNVYSPKNKKKKKNK